jgi:tRNA A37 threonylcarbamoyladenosine modification protein TsaB
MQGLAFTTGRPLLAVSALDALGQAASLLAPAGSLVAAWMDAFRGEVFGALYRTTDAAPFDERRLAVVEGPAAEAPAVIRTRWTTSAPAIAIGDGAVVYAHLLDPEIRVVAAPPLAGVIGRMAIARAREGIAPGPADVQPLYVRRPDAEVARDRRQTASESGSCRTPGSSA